MGGRRSKMQPPHIREEEDGSETHEMIVLIPRRNREFKNKYNIN